MSAQGIGQYGRFVGGKVYDGDERSIVEESSKGNRLA
jgi:hypothetical protein